MIIKIIKYLNKILFTTIIKYHQHHNYKSRVQILLLNLQVNPMIMIHPYTQGYFSNISKIIFLATLLIFTISSFRPLAKLKP